jgi:hypothetical protein
MHDFDARPRAVRPAIGAPVRLTRKDTHAVLEMPADTSTAARAALRETLPGLRVMSAGDTIEIYKEVGLPSDVADRFSLPAMTGHARHRPHPHGNGVCRHDHGRAPVLDRGPTSAWCTTARCPITTACAANCAA